MAGASILSQLAPAEKLAAAVSSGVLAALVLLLCLKLRVAPAYPDFIVGHLAWQARTKLQDLLAAPVFIAALTFSFLFYSRLLVRVGSLFGGDCSARLSEQLIWWSLPACAALSSLVPNAELDTKVVAISALGAGFISVSSACASARNVRTCPELLGLSVLGIFLLAMVPLEVALLLGRLPSALVGDIRVASYASAAYILLGAGLVIGLVAACRHPEKLSRFTPRLVLAGQLGLPMLFLVLYPARLAEPSGALTTYDTTIWLAALILGMVGWGLFDVVRRFRTHSGTGDRSGILSPVALFALLIAIKVGNTVPPHITPDDYHFGESLLGWWTYLHGTIPYVGYLPPHGLIDDDLTGLLASIFYDGAAGSIADAGRLSVAILGFVAFISMYLYSGSVGLAFVAAFFLGGRLTWFFLTPFLCLWLSRGLIATPAKWLAVWLLTIPIVILGVPPQGLLLVASSGVVFAAVAWRLLGSPEERLWSAVLVSVTILAICALATPLVPMLTGAVRYVLENAGINQVAYGVPWALSWHSGIKGRFLLEVTRMSWVVVPVACLALILARGRYRAHRPSPLLPVLVVLLFSLLTIPYSVGRIDAEGLSRPGLAAIFGWAILLPVISWGLLSRSTRAPFVLLIVCMAAMLGFAPLSVSGLVSATSSRAAVPPLRNGAAAGLTNVGNAYVQEDQWDRLTRLGALLNARLSPEQTYLDLTSRNAQYFYFNRLPAVAVTAPYNLVSRAQQARAVEELSRNLPALALLEGANVIHDGGGLALRTPYLYRLVVDNYVPRFEDGFIVGYRRAQMQERHETVDVAVKNVTNADWDRGAHRSEPALAVSDPSQSAIFKAGDRVRLPNGESRLIRRLSGNALWLEGSPMDAEAVGHPNIVEVAADPSAIRAYRTSLMQKAFSPSDLQRIPVAWGRSEKSLAKRMRLVHRIDGSAPSLHQLVAENGNYRVDGIDPQLNFDVSDLGLSGRDAGLLRLDFNCTGRRGDPRIQVFWWGDDQENASESSSLVFTADNGTLIVPLDASAFWLRAGWIKGIRIDLANADACSAFSVKGVGLFQRVF